MYGMGGVRIRRNVFAAIGVALVGLNAVPVRASDLGQSAQAQDRQVRFDIPAQPLPGALNLFGRQSGLQVTVDAAVAVGQNAKAVSGEMTTEQALSMMLAGTGLTWRSTDDRTVILVKAAPAGTTMLDQITVEQRRVTESAFGPVEGFVAGQSSTGTKTDTPIREVPQSISVITRDQMESRGARNVQEALRYTAGVTTGTRGDSSGLGGDNISIRGFGGDGTAGASLNEYWDGLRMLGTNYAVSNLDPFLFERVEVLRGPSSVLFGQNQPGGVVNQITKRPTTEALGQAQIRGGSFDTKDINIDLGGPLIQGGSLSYRMVGVLSDQNAQTDYTGRRRTALAPSLSVRPSDDTRLTLQTVMQHDDIDGGFVKYLPAYGTLYGTPNGKIARERFTGDPNYDKWDRKLFSLGYFLEHRLDESWSIRQNGRYVRNELDLKAVYLASLQANGRTINRTLFGALENSDAYTLDNQIEGKVSTGPVGHTILLGLDWQRSDSGTLRRTANGPTLDLYNPTYFQAISEPPIYQSIDTVRDQLGFYLQDQIKFDDWIVTLGGRRDRAESKATNNLTGAPTKADDHALTGRAGLGYAFQSGLTPYVSYSESFDPQSGTTFAGQPFVPTIGKQREIGLKYEPPGHNAFLSASAFELKQQNVLTTDPVNPNSSIQTGEVRSRGLELEAVASLDNGWTVAASYTYLDQEVTKSNSSNLSKRLVGIPEHQAALWIGHAFGAGPLRGVELGSGLRFMGGTAGDTTNTFMVPDYTLWDASAKYRLSALNQDLAGWKVAIDATNLQDKTYVASCSTNVRCYYGIGRTIFGRLSYEW